VSTYPQHTNTQGFNLSTTHQHAGFQPIHNTPARRVSTYPQHTNTQGFNLSTTHQHAGFQPIHNTPTRRVSTYPQHTNTQGFNLSTTHQHAGFQPIHNTPTRRVSTYPQHTNTQGRVSLGLTKQYQTNTRPIIDTNRAWKAVLHHNVDYLAHVWERRHNTRYTNEYQFNIQIDTRVDKP
ncbi:hypothetical protein RRG08_066700, partial [Elysia crispata]